MTPLTRFSLRSQRFAIDNGSFARFQATSFLSLLEREKANRSRCRFVAVPDVVGSARRTLEVFYRWRHQLVAWPLALVAQDGLEDLDIPWKGIAAVFIGGSPDTDWKLSKNAADVIKAAKAIGKWVHVGRVNSPGRFEYFENLGADSIDGTGLSRYSHMREAIWRAYNQPSLLHPDNVPAERTGSWVGGQELVAINAAPAKGNADAGVTN